MRIIVCFGLLLAASMTGYATEPGRTPVPTYWDLPTSYLIPKTEAERQRECARIRQEMARVESIARAENVTVPPMDSINVLVQARENMVRLNGRAAEVSCLTAISISPTSKKDPYGDCY